MKIPDFDVIRKLYDDIFGILEKSGIEMASPRFLNDNGVAWKIKDTFANEFGMFLVMLSSADKRVNETEMDFIRNLCHFHVDKYMVEGIEKDLDFFGEGTFNSEVPLFLMAVIDMGIADVRSILELYCNAGAAIVKCDDGPYVRELDVLRKYLVLMDEYIYKYSDNDTSLKCRKLLEEMGFEESGASEVSDTAVVSEEQDLHDAFLRIYNQCNIPREECRGQDIRSLLKKDFCDYIIYLSLLGGRVNEETAKLLHSVLGIDMDVDEIEDYLDDTEFDAEEFASKVPESFEILIDIENRQNRMSKLVMKGKFLDYSTHPCQSLITLYHELAVVAGSKGSGDRPCDSERYLQYYIMLKEYDENHLEK